MNKLDGLDHELTAKDVQETVLLLYISMAQIEMSMRDGDTSVGTLVESFKEMADDIRKIENTSKKISIGDDASDALLDIRDIIQSNSGIVSVRMMEAIIAFQFYDKLSQRVAHVSSSINGLSKLMRDAKCKDDKAKWSGLKEKVRSNNAMAEETLLYEAIMSGLSVEESVNKVREEIRLKEEASWDSDSIDDDDDIDLF
jgi:hypothetical protein